MCTLIKTFDRNLRLVKLNNILTFSNLSLITKTLPGFNALSIERSDLRAYDLLIFEKEM